MTSSPRIGPNPALTLMVLLDPSPLIHLALSVPLIPSRPAHDAPHTHAHNHRGAISYVAHG